MILVTGATGSVGGALVSRLSTAGAPVRALVRSRESGDNLRGYDVDLAIGSYEDRESLEQALHGVDTVFLIAPAGPDLAGQEIAVVEAAQAQAPGARVVKLAAAGVDVPGELPVRFARQHREVIDALAASRLPTTVLAPNAFMQNLLAQAGSVQEQGVLRAAVGDAAISFVDVRDVAAVAAHVLTSEGHEGATYTITGPAALTYADVAETMSRVLGRQVRHEDVPQDRAREDLLAAGVPEWTVDGLHELDEFYRSGSAAAVTDEVEKATGRPARSLEEFLTEHRAAFA